MSEVKKYSKFIRTVCAVFTLLGSTVLILELMTAEELEFHLKYVAIPFALFVFGFVAIKGENPMSYIDKLDKTRDKP